MSNEERKRQRRKEDRPGEIVKAAMKVFSECGFGNAKIADIAKQAGTAKGTVYLYFETKDKLFEAVVREYLFPAYAQAEKLLDGFPGGTRDLLSAVIKRFYQEISDNAERRGIMRIIITEGERFPSLTAYYYKEVFASAQQLIRRILERGVDSGEFRKTTAIDYPGVIVGPAVMAALWKMTFEPHEPLAIESFCSAHLDILFNGLQKRDDCVR